MGRNSLKQRPCRESTEELVGGLPFIDLELVEDAEFAILVEDFFATDRNEFPKGVIEVLR
jgi:hypothetical protein